MTESPIAVTGACSCDPAPADSADCTCAIGVLIDDIMRAAYWSNPEEAADALRRLIEQAPAVLARQNEKLMVRLSKTWAGTSRQFEERFKYSRGRLHAMGVRWRR